MRKLLQVVVAGLTAVSFSALAADKTEVDANTKIQGDTKAGSTGVDTKAGAGASTDIKTDKMDKKNKASADTKTEAAPAPAPAPVDRMKKAD